MGDLIRFPVERRRPRLRAVCDGDAMTARLLKDVRDAAERPIRRGFGFRLRPGA